MTTSPSPHGLVRDELVRNLVVGHLMVGHLLVRQELVERRVGPAASGLRWD
ncbi:MAG TPA: hypothetical protein VIW46_11835 [Acidimicrobiia bacterium]